MNECMSCRRLINLFKLWDLSVGLLVYIIINVIIIIFPHIQVLSFLWIDKLIVALLLCYLALSIVMTRLSVNHNIAWFFLCLRHLFIG